MADRTKRNRDNHGGNSERLSRIVSIIAVCAMAVFALAMLLEWIPMPEKKPEQPKDGQTMEAPQDAATPEKDHLSAPETETEVGPESGTEPKQESESESEPEPEPVVRQSSASLGAVGDILMHDDLIKSGYNRETGDYNYDEAYTWFGDYISSVDYAVANLEVTLSGNQNGYPYSGYPCFNAPDAIVDALKNAGFDLLLTANNHAYDTAATGFKRTQEVIVDRGLDHIGTRQKTEDPNYIIRDINGVKVGMTCYTYSNGYSYSGTYLLNGNPLSAEASTLINAFVYGDLEGFYSKLEKEIEQMKAEGAEAIVLFIHWGVEYQTKASDTQKKMAQRLCNLGVDVIVGNHAHVVQPVELLTSEEDESHKTVCLYSTGNSLSNFFETSNFPPHTEDGMLFTLNFAKYSDGTVLLERVDLMPTWVYRPYDDNGVLKFFVLCMEEGKDWQTEMELSDDTLKECEDSYARTMEIVEEGLVEANAWLAQNQAEVEQNLGVVPAA